MELEAIKEFLKEETGYTFTFTEEQIKKTAIIAPNDKIAVIIYLNDMYCNKFDSFDKAMCKHAFKEVSDLIMRDLI